MGRALRVEGKCALEVRQGLFRSLELHEHLGDVFRDLAQASGGDATAMAQALDRGRTDPRAFAATLSPSTLERLHQLSIKISDQRR